MILDATEKSLARFVDTAWMTSRNAFGEFGEDFIENELATEFPKPKLCDVWPTSENIRNRAQK